VQKFGIFLRTLEGDVFTQQNISLKKLRFRESPSRGSASFSWRCAWEGVGATALKHLFAEDYG
jgi:hypothetical protein